MPTEFYFFWCLKEGSQVQVGFQISPECAKDEESGVFR